MKSNQGQASSATSSSNEGAVAPVVRTKLIERVKSILITPKSEWARVDQESETVSGLYIGYVLPLAAIPPVASLIGGLLFGYSALGITYRPPLIAALISAVVQYGLTLVGVFVLALIINALAPKFDGHANKTQALKVAAYSATAAWIAGIFSILPVLSILSILGLYSLYLLYLGLPRLMKAPEEKAFSYTAVVVLATLVLGLIIGAVTAPVTRQFASSPDIGSIGGDIGIEEAFAALEESAGAASATPSTGLDAAASAARTGTTMSNPLGTSAGSVDQALLASLLPESVAGLPLTERESATVGGGLGSSAEAHYGKGGVTVTLGIIDMAPLGGISAVASSMSVERDRQTATGYERLGQVNGRMTGEKWDSVSKRGEYNVLVANRVMVSAEGRGVDIEDLKSAVSDLDLDGIEAAVAAKQ